MGISFVVAYHGERKYLEDCFSSLEAQTNKEFDVIVVCDSCTEEEKEAVAEMPASFPFTVLQTEGQSGVAAARNTGLHACTGEYVFFMDCDDFLKENAVERMLQQMEDRDVLYVRRIYSWIGYRGFLEMDKLPEDSKEKNTYLLISRVDKEDKTFPDMPEDLPPKEQVLYHLMRSVVRFSAISALNLLIRRDLLENQGICFPEDKQYMTDMEFVAQLFLAAGSAGEITDEPLYVKRRRNDPVNLPSLGQKRPLVTGAKETMKAYLAVKNIWNGQMPFLETCLDCKFIKDYVRMTIPVYMKEKKPTVVKPVYDLAEQCLQRVSADALRLARPYTRKSVKYSLSHTPEQIAARARRHSAFQTMQRTIGHWKKIRTLIYRKVFLKIPLRKERILFESFFGRNYSDSPKYIYEYIQQTYPGRYECVWALNKRDKLPYGGKKVKRFSLRYYYYLATSKYFVFNVRQPKSFVKRKGMVFLETWHGTPLKRLVFDQVEVSGASPLYKKQVYDQSRSWDYLIAPNQFSSDIFRSCFMYDKEMLHTGYPRNDILHLPERERSEKIAAIKKELNIPQDKKVILYAPTWRDDEFYDKGQYRFTLQLDLKRMQEKLSDEYVVVLRTHYFIVNVLDLDAYDGFVFNGSSYNDIAHLYLIADILITDYSSVFFDYANLRRPILFFMYDIEKYRDALRGFYIDVQKELPGPILQTSEEVIRSIENIQQISQDYQDKYNVFYDKYCGWEDGTSTKKVVEAVFRK